MNVQVVRVCDSTSLSIYPSYPPPPFQGRGLNTGVMLQDLKAMRDMNWKSVWKSVAVETLPKYGSTALADQVVTYIVLSNLVSEYTWGPSKLLLTISSTC